VEISDYTGPAPENAVYRIGKGAVGQAIYAPDGQFLLLSTMAGVYKYDSATGQEIWYRCCEAGGIALSPDGKLAAVSNNLGVVDLVDVESGDTTMTLTVGDAQSLATAIIRSIAFSSDGKTLVALTDTVSLWNVADGQKLLTLQPEGNVGTATFSPDGMYLVVGTDEGAVILSADTYETVQYAFDGTYIRDLEFSPDGKQLAANARESILLWDMETMQLSQEIVVDGQVFFFSDIAYSPDGKFLAAGSWENMILWSMPDAQERQVLQGEFSEIVFTPDSEILLTNNFNDLTFWDVNNLKPLSIWNGHARLSAPMVAPDGNTVFFVENDSVVFWDLESQQRQGAIEQIENFTLSADGGWLAGSSGTTVNVWDLSSSDAVASFEHEAEIRFLSLSPSGDLLAVGSEDLVSIWNVDQSQLVRDIVAAEIQAIALSPVDSLLAIATADVVKLIQIDEAKAERTLVQESRVDALAFSPDGRLLAVLAGDHTIWDVESGDRLARSGTFSGGQMNISFSPDGAFLANMNLGGEVRIWDWQSNEMAVLGHHGAPNFDGHISFSPGRNILASAGTDGTVIIWDLDTLSPFDP
jgi:WD40 repeat protein